MDCTFCVDESMEMIFVALMSGEILTCSKDGEGELEFKNVYNVSQYSVLTLSFMSTTHRPQFQ